jgi:hypothetical protein
MTLGITEILEFSMACYSLEDQSKENPKFSNSKRSFCIMSAISFLYGSYEDLIIVLIITWK